MDSCGLRVTTKPAPNLDLRLLDTVRAMLNGRGEISEVQCRRFTEASCSNEQLVDLIAAIAMKLITDNLGRLA